MEMKQLIEDFPSNLTEAITIAEKSQISKVSGVDNIVICGMGGSGIGGTIVSTWLAEELTVPVEVVKDYTLPNYVGPNTLVIGSSYSGNTEETLACIESASERGAKIIGISSGGKLEAFCRANNYNIIIVPGGNPPRTALAFSLVQLLNIFHQTGIIASSKLGNIQKSKQLILSESDTIHSEAKELASFLLGKVGILYSSFLYEGVVVRARQQFNENSKLLCWHHLLPEMNHNELVGWYGGDDRFAVVFFETDDMHPRNKVRMEITRQKVSERTQHVCTIKAKGSDMIERSLYLINLVDWASLYLAELKKEDPINIEVIDYLKSELAKF